LQYSKNNNNMYTKVGKKEREKKLKKKSTSMLVFCLHH
jgi:hypothetical protein